MLKMAELEKRDELLERKKIREIQKRGISNQYDKGRDEERGIRITSPNTDLTEGHIRKFFGKDVGRELLKKFQTAKDRKDVIEKGKMHNTAFPSRTENRKAR